MPEEHLPEKSREERPHGLLPHSFDRPLLRILRWGSLVGILIGTLVFLFSAGAREALLGVSQVGAFLLSFLGTSTLLLIFTAWGTHWRWEVCSDGSFRPWLFVLKRRFPWRGSEVPILVSVTGRPDPFQPPQASTGGSGSSRRRRKRFVYFPVLVDEDGFQYRYGFSGLPLADANRSAEELAQLLRVSFLPGQSRAHLVTRTWFGLGGACQPIFRGEWARPLNLILLSLLVGSIVFVAIGSAWKEGILQKLPEVLLKGS